MPPELRSALALPLNPAARLTTLWGKGLILPLLPTLYVLVLVVAGGQLRPEHLAFVVVALGLGLGGPRSAKLYLELLPYVLVGLGYDLVRYARLVWVTPERVFGCGFRRLEATLFPAGAGSTWPDWFATHHRPALDLVAAVPYAGFAYFALGYAVWLWFRDRPRMRWFLWSFALANGISFVTWLVLPTAPPWYLRLHGCAIDLSALPSPAGLARVDARLGIHYFSTFYSRTASVFGALPSMHAAYPMLGLLTAFRVAGWRVRVLHVGYVGLMAFSAVYLVHHWVLDVLAGWLTAVVATLLARRLLAASGRAFEPSPARGGA